MTRRNHSLESGAVPGEGTRREPPAVARAFEQVDEQLRALEQFVHATWRKLASPPPEPPAQP